MVKKSNIYNIAAKKQNFIHKGQLLAKKQISIIGMASKNNIKVLQRQREERLNHLENLGLTVENEGMSVYLNRLSPGCVDCSRGTALSVVATRECNRKCFFCPYRRPHKQKIKLMNTIKNICMHKNYILSLAITGGECLLDLIATINILEFAKTLVGDICQTRIYTNGDMLNRSILKKLQAARLDEIRISIKPDTDFKKIALAKEYVPRVMVETPVFPDKDEEMKGILLKLNELKIFGVNLLEFQFCCRNARLYKRRGYKLMTDKVNDFSVPFPYCFPVYGTETACFNLLEFAAKKNFLIGVHYCSQNNERYGNYSDRLKKLEIGKRLKSEFIKNKKLNKEQRMLKFWPDQSLKKKIG